MGVVMTTLQLLETPAPDTSGTLGMRDSGEPLGVVRSRSEAVANAVEELDCVLRVTVTDSGGLGLGAWFLKARVPPTAPPITAPMTMTGTTSMTTLHVF